MLCTSSWNVSGRQCLLLPFTGATWRLVPFLWMLYLILFLCPAQSRSTELYISTNPDGLGPLYQPHSSYRRGSDFMRYKVLKQRKNWKHFNKKTENGYLSGLLCPAAHKQKSLLPVSVTALIQAQTDPIAEDLPASCRPGQPWPEGSFSAAPASRGSPLYRYICQQFLCTLGTMIHRHCWNAVLQDSCIQASDAFLFQKVFVWYKLKKSNMYFFPQIREKNRFWVGC